MLFETICSVNFSEKKTSTSFFVILKRISNVFVLSDHLHKCVGAFVRGALYAIYDPFKQVRTQGIFGSFHPLNFKTKFEWSNEGSFPDWLFVKEFISLENIARLMLSFMHMFCSILESNIEKKQIIFIIVHMLENYNNFWILYIEHNSPLFGVFQE